MFEIICTIISCWLGGATGLFLVFNLRPYNVTITHTDTGEQETLFGRKKILVILLLSFLWPIVLVKNLIERMKVIWEEKQ